MARPARFSLDIGVGAKLTCGFEARQVTRRAAALAALVFVGGGCGSWQRVGSPDNPRPGSTVPRLFDATSVYRSMGLDRKSTRLNSSHSSISYAVFCLKKKKLT